MAPPKMGSRLGQDPTPGKPLGFCLMHTHVDQEFRNFAILLLPLVPTFLKYVACIKFQQHWTFQHLIR